MRFLLGAMPYNAHLQQVALALWEAGWLGGYFSGGVDNYRTAWGRFLRGAMKALAPAADRYLARRRVTTVPDQCIHHDWLWELPRAVSSRLGWSPLAQDWLWERSEHRLDRRCARLVRRDCFDALIGVEHGCLRAVQAARQAGKPAIVTFLSPHHAFRERWVEAEYERFPELLTACTKYRLELGRARDARRDEEARAADLIHTNSPLTTRSLIESGLPAERFVTVPYGCPRAMPAGQLKTRLSRPMRFIYAGILSVRKGGHYLLDAWRKLGAGSQAELHCYGLVQLPQSCLSRLPGNVHFHGSVSQDELFRAYERAAILVFPTLCDGFGLVAAEALSRGLPVLTTRNAGVADLIVDEENGLLVPPGDTDSLAARMAWCLRNADHLQAMRRSALDTARDNSWDCFRARLRRELAKRLGLVPRAPVPAATRRPAVRGAVA